MGADRLRAVIGSVVVHLIAVGVLAFTMWESPKPPAAVVSKPLIQARAVDEATAMAPVRRREAEERHKKETADKNRKEAAAEKKRKAEQKREEVAAEKRRKADLKKKKATLEKKRQAELKKKQQQQEAEKKRLAEIQRNKDEALKKKKEEAEKRRKQREDKLKQEMAVEDARIQEDERRFREQQMSGMVNQYLADITNKVQRNWLRLTGMPKDFRCKVEVRQIPGGEVVGVRMIESSGDAALDRSVEAAVWKASPLPAPPSPELFDREVVITFVPK